MKQAGETMPDEIWASDDRQAWEFENVTRNMTRYIRSDRAAPAADQTRVEMALDRVAEFVDEVDEYFWQDVAPSDQTRIYDQAVKVRDDIAVIKTAIRHRPAATGGD